MCHTHIYTHKHLADSDETHAHTAKSRGNTESRRASTINSILISFVTLAGIGIQLVLKVFVNAKPFQLIFGVDSGVVLSVAVGPLAIFISFQDL